MVMPPKNAISPRRAAGAGGSQFWSPLPGPSSPSLALHLLPYFLLPLPENPCKGNSLAVQWLGLRTFTAKGPGSIPGQGIKIPQAVRPNKEPLQRLAPLERRALGTLPLGNSVSLPPPSTPFLAPDCLILRSQQTWFKADLLPTICNA